MTVEGTVEGRIGHELRGSEWPWLRPHVHA